MLRKAVEEQKNEEFIVSIPEGALGETTGREKDVSPTRSSVDVPLLRRQSRDVGPTPFRKDSGTHKSSLSGPSTHGEHRKSVSQSVQQIIGKSNYHIKNGSWL